ncbi:hypothetical protein BGZ98_009079 [Dissophora globulifera]|nr:hypothetical protein BGZ98_009079 [Dissophora globulifera]
MDFTQFNDAERKHLQRMMEQKQLSDFFKMYNTVVDRCFNDCINDFTSKAISSKEASESCVSKCMEKFMKHAERVNQRYAEVGAEMMGGSK